ncbi:MAG: hypothetical protein DME36_09730 [Verrucomicrobia bacterium]|nr:MAG: hypothetical protein DME36_09730 [Verrucomicrobiota bacterium]
MRFPLDVPVVFWWTDTNGVHQQGEGRSCDISVLGAFVLARAYPPEGTQVGLRIPITQFPDVAEPLRMEMEGRVLRIEEVRSGEGRDGFAILSEPTILRELDNSTASELRPSSQGQGARGSSFLVRSSLGRSERSRFAFRGGGENSVRRV